MQSGRNIKNQRGFTLVEVIVVAVIVAALAGVAIPMYTSYVTSSRDNAAANAAGSVASFMGSCLNRAKVVTGITEDEMTAGEANLTLTCDAGEATATTIQLPLGIRFQISSLNSSPGIVTARHIDSETDQTYNY